MAKRDRLEDIMRDYLHQKTSDGKSTRVRAFVAAVYELAVERKHINAMKLIWVYYDGQPRVRLDVHGQNDVKFLVERGKDDRKNDDNS